MFGEKCPKSGEAHLRLEWMLYFRVGNTTSQTCVHFGIARSVFYKWKPLFDLGGVEALETRSRAPKNTRQWKITAVEEYRIKAESVLDVSQPPHIDITL